VKLNRLISPPNELTPKGRLFKYAYPAESIN
jgi:hypothetical protein